MYYVMKGTFNENLMSGLMRRAIHVCDRSVAISRRLTSRDFSTVDIFCRDSNQLSKSLSLRSLFSSLLIIVSSMVEDSNSSDLFFDHYNQGNNTEELHGTKI